MIPRRQYPPPLDFGEAVPVVQHVHPRPIGEVKNLKYGYALFTPRSRLRRAYSGKTS